jgi:hypothetical protein
MRDAKGQPCKSTILEELIDVSQGEFRNLFTMAMHCHCHLLMTMIMILPVSFVFASMFNGQKPVALPLYLTFKVSQTHYK